MGSVIFTPMLAQTNLAAAIAAGIAIGASIGALITYLAFFGYRSRYLAAAQQLANLQGQSTSKRTSTVGIPHGQPLDSPLPPPKTGLPPKKEKPKREESDPELLRQLDALTEQNQLLQQHLAAERQQLDIERQQLSQLKQSMAEQATLTPTAPSDQQWQLDQLHKENIALQTTIDQYREQLEQSNASFDADVVRQMEQEKAKLQEHLDGQQATISQLTAELNSARVMLPADDEETSVHLTNETISTLSAENAALKSQLAQLASSQTGAEQLADELRSRDEQLRDAQLHIEQSEQANHHLQAQINEYEANISRLEQQIDDSTAGRNAVHESLDELRTVLAQSEAAVASLEREKLDYKNQIDELRRRMASDAALLSESSDATVEENEANRILIKQLKQELVQRDEQMLAVHHKMNDLYLARDRVASLEIAMAERNATVERLESEVRGLREAVNDADDDHEVESLKQELAGRTSEAVEAQATIADLQETLDAAKRELDAERTRSRDEAELSQRLKSELDNREAQEERLRSESDILRQELDELSKRLEAERENGRGTQEELNSLRSDVSRLGQDSQSSALRFAELTQTVAQLTNELEVERTKTPEPVAQRLGELQQQLTQRNSFADQATSELNELRSALQELQTEKERIEQDRDEAKRSAAELREQAGAVTKELDDKLRDAKSQLEQTASEHDKANRKIADLAEQIQGSHSAQSEIAALQQQVMTLISDKEKHRADRDEAQERVEELEAEMAAIKESAGSVDSSAEERFNDAKLEVEQLKLTCLKFQADAESAVNELADANSQLTELQATVDLLDSVKDELKRKVDGLEEQTTQLKLEVTERDRMIDSLSSENKASASLAEELSGANQQIQQVRQLLDEANTRRNKLQTANEEAQAKIAELQDELANLDAAAAHGESTSREERTVLQHENMMLKSQLQQLAEHMDESEDQDRQSKHVDEERLELQAALRDRDQQIQDMQASIDSAKQQAGLAEEQLASEKSTKYSLQTKVEELTATVLEARTKNQSLAGQLAAEQRVISQLKSDLEESKSLAADGDDNVDELGQIRDEIKALKVKLEQRDKLVEAAEKQLAVERAAVSAANSRIEQLEKVKRNSDSANEKLQSAVAQIKELEASLSARADHGDAGSANETTESLKAKVAEYEEEQNLLIAEMRQLREQADALKQQLLQAEAQREALATTSGNREASDDAISNANKENLDRQLKELEKELNSTQEELFKQSEAANAWRKERSDLLNQIESLTQQADQANVKLKGVEKSDDVEEVSSLVGRRTQLEKELEKAERVLESKDHRLDEIAAALAASRREVSSLESELSLANAMLRNRHDAVGADHVNSRPGPTKAKKAKAKSAAKKPSTDKKTKTDRQTKSTASQVNKAAQQPEGVVDENIGQVYVDPPEQRDNLRKISGLGPKFEEKLNELGIYQYSQIAQWNAKIANEVSERIGAGPRIKKDKWIQQAKQLAKKTGAR